MTLYQRVLQYFATISHTRISPSDISIHSISRAKQRNRTTTITKKPVNKRECFFFRGLWISMRFEFKLRVRVCRDLIEKEISTREKYRYCVENGRAFERVASHARAHWKISRLQIYANIKRVAWDAMRNRSFIFIELEQLYWKWRLIFFSSIHWNIFNQNALKMYVLKCILKGKIYKTFSRMVNPNKYKRHLIFFRLKQSHQYCQSINSR